MIDLQTLGEIVRGVSSKQETMVETIKRLQEQRGEPLTIDEVAAIADHERMHAMWLTGATVASHLVRSEVASKGTVPQHLLNRTFPPSTAEMMTANAINTSIMDDDDVEREAYLNNVVLGKLERYIRDEFGEPCSSEANEDFEPECCVCQAWEAYRNLRKALTVGEGE